jgi:hypothetical protein
MMEININKLLAYFEKQKFDVQIKIGDKYIKFLKGKDDNGSNARILEYGDFMEILRINNIIEKSNKINERKEGSKYIEDMNNLLDEIYTTLTKYIINYFEASINRKRVYIEIKMLPAHEQHFDDI